MSKTTKHFKAATAEPNQLAMEHVLDRLRKEYIEPKNKWLHAIGEPRRFTITQDEDSHVLKFGDQVASEIWPQNKNEIAIKTHDFNGEDSDENIAVYKGTNGKFDQEEIFFVLEFQLAGELSERAAVRMQQELDARQYKLSPTTTASSGPIAP